MVTTRGGGNLRRSNRQAGKGWSSLVAKKTTKKPKKKSLEKLVKVNESRKEKEKEMDKRGKADTLQMDEGRRVDEEEEVVQSEGEMKDAEEVEVESEGEMKDAEEVEVESEGEKEDAEDVQVESEGEKEDAEEVEVESEGEKEAAEDMAVESVAEEEDADELPLESTEGDKENAGDDTQVAPQSTEGDTVNASNGGDSAKQSTSTTKRTRGKTRMRKLAKDEDVRIEVDFSSFGEHAGSGSNILSSFLGVLVKEYVSVLLNDWRKLDQETKDRMWEEIQGRFKVHEEWQRHSLFKQMNCMWRSAKSILVGQVRAASNHAERLALKPSNIPSVTEWNKWVKSKLTKESKEKSEIMRKLRKSQIPQTSSRKGLYRLGVEMKKKSSDPSKITRSKIWIAGHTHKDGRPVKPEFAETIEQIKTIDSQMESTANDNIREDAVSQVLGRDKPGRIRGLGRGITATKLAVLQARDTHVQKLEATQAELRSEVQDLRNMVNVLAGKNKKTDNVGAHSGVSHVSGGVRCQLLDWIADKDIVVGEGEFCSSDPLYKIGRIPLGPNAAAVIVKSVKHPGSQLWRPAQNIVTLGEAVGLKIPWQGNKVIVDEDISTSPNITSGSKETISPDESLERCKLFDWNSDDTECIAEGVLCSTDPKEMINNIPIGLNACIVKIDLVLRDKAYLWRPTADLHVMADAMGRQIQWPLTKMKRMSQNAEVPLVRSSPGNGSSNAGSSKGKNKKCLLLDCKNSDLTVAEGRVLSTDPEEKVHHKPLGQNASKVWVVISLKDNAEVWRPSSEVQFIGDAQGTTVAWPNDKIVYL